MNVFGVGLPEMALILVLALLVFGPKKLPEIGQSLAKTIKSFQNASREFEEELKREAQQIEKAVTTPMKATLEADPQKVLTAPAAETEAAPDSALEAAADASPEAAIGAVDAGHGEAHQDAVGDTQNDIEVNTEGNTEDADTALAEVSPDTDSPT